MRIHFQKFSRLLCSALRCWAPAAAPAAAGSTLRTWRRSGPSRGPSRPRRAQGSRGRAAAGASPITGKPLSKVQKNIVWRHLMTFINSSNHAALQRQDATRREFVSVRSRLYHRRSQYSTVILKCVTRSRVSTPLLQISTTPNFKNCPARNTWCLILKI